MALNFFKQRDIDMMDPNDIPEAFIDYFDTLPEERKAEIIASRPDLAEGLGYGAQDTVTGTDPEDDSENMNPVKKDRVGVVDEDGAIEDSVLDGDEEDIFALISNNLYENVDLDKVLVDGLNPLEALTVPNKTEKCPLHRNKFEHKQIKYRAKTGSTYGLVLRLCRECKRVYQEESQVEYVHKALVERGINHTFYDAGLTNLYLRSQQSAYLLNDDEKIYVPDTWVEEDPMCPVHEESLYEIPCEKVYSGRKVSFTGYFCEHCNKILVRKAVAVDLVDECAMQGVPEIEYESLVKRAPKKKAIKPKEIRPDYFVQDGKRVTYTYNHNADCFKLTEEDTIVVSDSVYCNLEGHDTEEVLALIMVKEKRGGRKAYLFMVGYCAQCQKYYMDEDDYKVVYSVGRPEVTILSDVDSDSYQITSGEVFNLERNHLGRLESNIEGEISSIHNQKDYVNPYAVGDYDDGNLSYAKSVSKSKYGPRLEELTGYQPKPYSYRVDITCDGETETYYVGPSDIDLGGKRRVISFNSDFGHELVNYQTIKINKDGKEYDIKLSRQFDIDHATLYGYANLRTDEDIIFRSGVTDPFLVRVLNMRKKQHNLIDIIATIQENQNKIVDVDFGKNLIVQGCAGSGKTMVLLHRLSSLQYKQRYFDFGDQALILTPNDQFSLHIKGLAEGLQIGNIERISVEQYYVEMLRRYSDDFKLDTKLSSEMFVRQDYVDYIYSDQFRLDFDAAYSKVISDRNALAEILDNLTDAMGQPARTINYDDDTRVVQQIKFGVDAMDGIIQKHQTEILRAQDALDRVISRKQFLEGRIPEAEQFAAGIVQESLPRVFAKISTFVSERQYTISQLEEHLQTLTTERQRVQGAIIMFGKRARLEQLDNEIKETERKLNSERKKAEDENAVLSLPQTGKTDDEILAWMGQVMLYIKEVQDEIRLCKNSKHEAEIFRAELENDIPAQITAAQEELDKITSITYPEEASRAIQYLNDKLAAYTLLGTCQMVFEEAVAKFKEEHNVKAINGKYHRYDLYARLLFAMKFFKTVHGTTRFMCVDEGQDLAFNEYRLLFELNEKNLTFNIYGDTNQLMKPGRGIADWSELKKVFGAAEYTLNENYRNTNQITRFCNSSFGMDVLQTGVDGAKVREIARKELESELAELNITTERVAILVPRGVQKKKYLDENLLPSHIRSIIGDNMDNGYISMMYVDEVKGIEFDKVYVVGNKMTRNEKYIAYTRALSELILVVDDSVADYDDGSDKGKSDQPKKDKKPKKKISNTGTLTYKGANQVQTFTMSADQEDTTEGDSSDDVDQLGTNATVEEELDVVDTSEVETMAEDIISSDKKDPEADSSDVVDVDSDGTGAALTGDTVAIVGSSEYQQLSFTMQEGEAVLTDDHETPDQLRFDFSKSEMKTPKNPDQIARVISCVYKVSGNKCVHVDCDQFGKWCVRENCLYYYGADSRMTRDEAIALNRKIKEWERIMRAGKSKNPEPDPLDNPIVDKAVPFEGVKEISMRLIKLPGHFRSATPSPGKVEKMIEYYQEHGKFDKPVKVLLQGDNYLLKDKYLRYHVAKLMNLKTIEAEFDDKKKPIEDDKKNDQIIVEPLKNIAGSALKEGTYLNGKYSDAEIRDAITSVFASSAKKDTSYKFVFLKAIIDCMYDVQQGFKLSFDQLFERFAEIYWPMVVEYDIHQKVGADSQSYIEQFLIEAANKYGLGANSQFSDLTRNQQRDVVKAVKQKCKMNVVGALYGDTKGIFYSFSRKEEWIEINPLVFHFLMRHGDEIQELNYKAWAEFMERVNEAATEEKVRKQYGKPTGTGANLYHQILKSTFMIGLPMLALWGPVIGNLLSVS